jgi:hypothetical protein
MAVTSGTPASQDLGVFNIAAAKKAGININGILGTGIGNISPVTGAVIIPDPITGLPFDSLTGLPAMPISSFDQFMAGAMTPTDTGNMGAGVTDPLAEFLSTPAADLGGSWASTNLDALNLNPTGTGSFLDTLAAPAADPTVVDFSTPTFDMGSYVDPYATTPAYDPTAGWSI